MVKKCCHYWVIAPANGQRSKGRCKLCGIEKKFYNYFVLPNPYKPNDKGNKNK